MDLKITKRISYFFNCLASPAFTVYKRKVCVYFKMIALL